MKCSHTILLFCIVIFQTSLSFTFHFDFPLFFRCSVSENAIMNDPVSSERENLHHDDQGWNTRTDSNTEEGLFTFLLQWVYGSLRIS